MILIDSSVVIAIFRKNEIHHKEALGILQLDSNF
jgi:predicted nucleic acid-binding protein